MNNFTLREAFFSRRSIIIFIISLIIYSLSFILIIYNVPLKKTAFRVHKVDVEATQPLSAGGYIKQALPPVSSCELKLESIQKQFNSTSCPSCFLIGMSGFLSWLLSNVGTTFFNFLIDKLKKHFQQKK